MRAREELRPPFSLAAESGVPLAPLTTLELGGSARFFVDAQADGTVREALRWAREVDLPVAVLAGGSNVVVADGGFDGLVIRMAQRGVSVERGDELVRLTAHAGQPWDDLVAMAVAEGWAGLECLSGIPGTAGATPIQNVGAYGQEVADTVVEVLVLDRSSLAERVLRPSGCRFTYRSSAFRREPERFVVLAVSFALRRGGSPTLCYPELVRALAARHATPTLAEVRAAVLALRRAKSMLLDDPNDDNRRSVGSFFTNPVVRDAVAEKVVARAVAAGVVRGGAEVPRFAADPGLVKLSAAWLIEHAGFAKGHRHGHVGISSRHALALVHHGGGTTTEFLALAAHVRRAVHERFGVTLVPEPAFIGFPPGDPLTVTA